MTKSTPSDDPANSASSIDFAGNVVSHTNKIRPVSTNSENAYEQRSASDKSHSTDDTHRDIESQQQEATVTVVGSLEAYKGRTLEEKVDSFIADHPVVMFNKTWCLFSVDAQQFLIEQMKVSIHCIEVDIHPQGKAILKHIQEKTGHKTVPVIYVKGAFLGGFEDVNQLYATGKLQNEYLKDLTQADRCEEFISKSKIGVEPMFWFPSTVNAYVIRLTGIMTCICSALSAVSVQYADWGRYIGYALFFDFVLRLLAGSRLSIVGRIATVLAMPLEPKPRHGRPKQFATMCGVVFSGLGSLFYVLDFPNHDYVGTAFMGGLAIASGMEGFLDFCVGCVMFKYGIKLGLIRK